MFRSYLVGLPVDEDRMNGLRKVLDELYEFNGDRVDSVEKMNMALGLRPPEINSENVTGLSLDYRSLMGRTTVYFDSKEKVLKISNDTRTEYCYEPEFEYTLPLEKNVWSEFVEKISASGILWLPAGEQPVGEVMKSDPEWEVRAWNRNSEAVWYGKRSVPDEVFSLLFDVEIMCDGTYYRVVPDLRKMTGISIVNSGRKGICKSLGIDEKKFFIEDHDGRRSEANTSEEILSTASRILRKYRLVPDCEQHLELEDGRPSFRATVYIAGLGHYTVRWMDDKPAWTDSLFNDLYCTLERRIIGKHAS